MPPDSIVQGKTRGVEAGVADIGYGYKQNTTFKEVATSNSNSLKLVTGKPLVSRKSRKHITQRAEEAANNRTGAKWEVQRNLNHQPRNFARLRCLGVVWEYSAHYH